MHETKPQFYVKPHQKPNIDVLNIPNRRVFINKIRKLVQHSVESKEMILEGHREQSRHM